MADKKRLAQTQLPDGRIIERPWQANELYQLYMRGWRDGASIQPMRKDHMSCPEYETGYADGSKDRQAASVRAAKRLKHKPNILRLAKGETHAGK